MQERGLLNSILHRYSKFNLIQLEIMHDFLRFRKTWIEKKENSKFLLDPFSKLQPHPSIDALFLKISD